jgi:hypothetical protein
MSVFVQKTASMSWLWQTLHKHTQAFEKP